MENTVKKYKPKGVICIFQYVFASLIDAVMIFMWIYVFINYEDEIDWIFALFTGCVLVGLCIGTTSLISLFYKKIVIDAVTIQVPKDRKGGFRVLQQEVNLPFTEINDIKMVAAATDTNGQEQRGLFFPMPQIYIDCKNGEFKMINVYEYSRKQICNILDDIIARANEVGGLMECKSGKEILDDFFE